MEKIESLDSQVCPLSGETAQEEIWNYRTHFFGLLCSIIAFFDIIYNFSYINEGFLFYGIYLYGFSQIFVFCASSIYHKQVDIKRKSFWRIMDHISIFFFLLGTYSPFLLGPFIQFHGLEMFVIICGLVALGCYLKIFFFEQFYVFSLPYYASLFIVFFVQFLFLRDQIPFSSFLYGILGSMSILTGVGFFRWEALRFNHTIWHIFTLVTALFNYRSIYVLLCNY